MEWPIPHRTLPCSVKGGRAVGRQLERPGHVCWEHPTLFLQKQLATVLSWRQVLEAQLPCSWVSVYETLQGGGPSSVLMDKFCFDKVRECREISQNLNVFHLEIALLLTQGPACALIHITDGVTIWSVLLTLLLANLSSFYFGFLGPRKPRLQRRRASQGIVLLFVFCFLPVFV